MKNISYILIACYPDKGMKSYGSKSLMIFDKKKLLDYQCDWINQTKTINNEIMVITDFDSLKVSKTIQSPIRSLNLVDYNPIYFGCLNAKYDDIIFIDYGCLFNPSILKFQQNKSSILSVNEKKTKTNLDIGCLVKNDTVEHIFFDLPNDKFCNIFYISSEEKSKILSNKKYRKYNLLNFEIINMLINDGSVFSNKKISSKDFLYFTMINQKNGVKNFVKKISN